MPARPCARLASRHAARGFAPERGEEPFLRDLGSVRKDLGWINRGAHHAPRSHDLRHTFVVRRIRPWQQHGVDVDEAMLALSTDVGHAMVTSTYWYLQAVPE